MDQTLLVVVRDLGTVGILGLSLLLIVRAIEPLVRMIADAQKQQAESRREQTETNKAVLKRWEQSDTLLESHSQAFTTAMRGVTDELRELKITDTQRIKQNDVTAAQITGAREDIRQLPALFEKGKNDAVDKVNKAMDDKLKPIEQTLQSIQKQVAEALNLLHTVTAERIPWPPQEHYHTVTMSPAPAVVTDDTAPEPPATTEESHDG